MLVCLRLAKRTVHTALSLLCCFSLYPSALSLCGSCTLTAVAGNPRGCTPPQRSVVFSLTLVGFVLSQLTRVQEMCDKILTLALEDKEAKIAERVYLDAVFKRYARLFPVFTLVFDYPLGIALIASQCAIFALHIPHCVPHCRLRIYSALVSGST